MGLNRIYKVIWSKTKGCYVVVSEMAKRVGRNKAKAIVMSTAAMSMAVAVAPAVMNVDRVEASVLIGAADGTTISANKSTVSNNGIIIGGAISKAADESVIIGDNSGSMGSRNVVIGTYASAGYDEKKNSGNPPKDGAFNQSVAIGAGRAAGEGARAYGDQSIAIGSNTIARGNSSIAIGNDDVDKTDEIETTYTDLEGNTKTDKIGNAYKALTGQSLGPKVYQDTTSKEAAVAIGVKAVAGDISLALGTGANADRVNAVAIGSGATATRDNAVAIGGGATTEAPGTKEVHATINGLKFTWAGGDNTLAGDVVSFGKAGYERQLKHVAAGNVSENSTDAINGSQFYGVLKHLTADPVYFYGADDSTAGKIEGVEAAEKSADALKKKVVAKSMADSRLNLLGGADKEKLSENNIGVTYGDTSSIRFRLSKELAGLTSAEFKNTAGDVTTINGDGVTITPVANGKKPVSVTKNGLNNGGNVIANVAGSLEGAKPNSTAPTTSATAPNNASTIKNNAATVGDVLQAGWNLQNNSEERDFVKPYDTVNFEDGNGTTAVVDTDNTTSTVKYNVNLGNGLDKTKDNKITVKPADKSLEVNKAGVKVKTDGTTITTGDSGLTVVTGGIEDGTTPGTVKVTDGDNDKIATVDSVVGAVNKAAFTLKASADGGTLNANSTAKATGELIKAGNTIEMIAGKNLEVKHNKNGKITFATVENPSFNTVQIGDDGPKFSATSGGNISVSDKDGTNPVKITNVKDGDITKTSKDAINGSQFHAVAKNTIKLAGQNGTDTATETAGQELDKQGGIKFTVKSSDGKLLDITADANGDTITITPKTGTITTTDGVPTAVTTNGKLVTVDEVVKALKDLGWKATAGTDGTGSMIGTGAAEELIKAGDTVTFKAGNNLSIKQDGKNFIYSLNPALTGLTSAEFKDGDNKVKITPTGITITKPAGTTENTVTLNQNGLNNGGNPITNVAGNLQGAKPNSTEPTTSATAPTLGIGADEVNKNNAATVGDVLNAGWNLQEKGVAKDFVKPYDTVNFIDGDGTSVAVATANDGTKSTVKYSVNLGNGLEKTTDNKITVKPADKSLEVTTAGLKAKTDNTTITTGDSGLKVVTGGIEAGTTPGTMKVTNGDTGKIATVDSVVDAVNSAAFTLKASAITGGTRNTGSTVTATGESIKAGNTIEMIAGKNLDVTHNTNGKIIFATVENPSFNTVQIGNSEGPKFSATADGNIKVSDKTDTKPVKITNVADGTISDSSKDAINGSQIHKLVNKAIKLAGQNGSEAAGETEPQTLTQQDPIKFTVKSSDGSLLQVAAAGSTITLTPKTGTITTTGGVPTATTTNGKLVTADEVVNALTEIGWKATAGTDGTGTMIGTGAAEELIKAGNTVTFKAGDNLAIKQDGKNFIYSLKTDLTGLTSAEFKDGNNNAVKITPNGVSFKKPNATDADTVTLNQNGLNNGGNPITNVAGNLQGAKAGTDAPTTNATAPSLGTGTDQVNKNNAATVGDVLNAGWNLQEKGVAKDFVKPYDTVNFMDGDGTSVAVGTDGTTSTVKYSVNTGDGLEKNKDNKITVKVADKSLEVSDAGVAVKKADQSLEVTDDGLKVKTDNTTIKTGDTGLTVNTGTINKVTEGNTAGTVVAKTGDENKIATVSNVVEAINNAAWTATSAATSAGELGATATNQLVKAGDKVTFEADKNIKITQAGSKFTFTTRDDVSFNTVQIGGNQGPKFSKTDAGDIKVSGSDNTTPVKITNVQDGAISADSKDAINGSQFYAVAKNTIKLAGQNGTSAATETDEQELDTKGGIKFTVKSSNGDLLEVTAAKDTITITPKTATITTGKDGIPTANTDGGKLVTADNLVNALTEMGWKATADKDGTGTVTGNASELIKAGETVTFKAGDNLSIKQDRKNFIYSLNPALTGLTSAEFKDGKNNKVNITPEGITITKPAGTPENTVTLNQNGLNNGGNTISNVKSNLPDTKNSDTTTGPNTATKSHVAPTLGTSANEVNPANAATVGDVLNAGWNLQGNGTEVDFVKPYDTVNFVNGVNTTAVVSTVDGKTSNVTYNVTGLPITYTDKDGNLVSKIGDNFYKVNEKGQPLDAKGNPSTKVNKDGKPVDDAGKVIDPINTTNNPVKTSLVNPAPETNKTGTTSPTTLDNVTSKLENYKADPVNGKNPAKNSLRDLTNTNVTNDTVATVGDIRNMGWIVSSDKTTGANGAVTADEYSEAVKNANEVRFVGEGSAIVSGKTAGNVRTITVKVDNQTGTNKTVTPVNYTKVDGTKVYPQEVDNGNGTKTVKFFENPDGSGKEIPKSDVVTSINGPEGTKNPATLKNVKNNIPNVNDGSKTITDTDGNETAGDVTNINKAPLTAEEAAALANPKTKEGQTNPKYIGNNAATVSDVLNAGWNLQGNGTAKDFVKPYDTVNFVNGLNTTAVVTTSDDGTTSNVTYNVTGLPVTYTTTDGTPVTKIGDKYYKVNDKGQPVDGTGAPVTKFNKDGKPLDKDGHEVPDVNITDTPLKTSLVNPAPAADKTGTTSPTTLSNVKSNLPDTKNNDATTGPSNATTAQAAPNITDKTGNNYVNPNNAATVSDVLNAGWNLQGNGADVDFVKPYDKVNFVNGLNTTAVVSTVDGVTSNVTFNVTGLPITYTDKDGKPVSKIGDNFYTVNDKGQPLDSKGNPSTKVNNEGKPVDDAGNVITPIDTTNNPVKTSLVNPAPGANKTGTTSPTTLDNVTSKLENYKDAPVNGKDPVRNGLVNLSKPENGQPNVSDNTVATVGDLRNMGWIVSSNKTTGENGAVTADEYSATVKNANEVKFVGEGTAIVSGKTEGDVRTITVKVDDQTSTNNAVTPVVYTDKDGKQVYPTGKVGPDGNQIFNTKPDGKGEEVTGPVKTTINGPKGTNSPTSLNNVKNNIPNVNDGSKTITDTDGNETAGDVTNINKAPLTAEEAAALANPKTKEGQTNPKYIGNNAATVSDVLNAGWNLQGNGAAKDFVKPYDTVNFINGLNTTAVVTTSDDGTISNVTYNVTGLPVTYTTTDGTPVTKIGDKYYKVNDQGQPVDGNGAPVTKFNKDGKPLDANGHEVPDVDITNNPLTTSVVNAKPAADKTSTTSPTTLSNVEGNLDGAKTNTIAPITNATAPNTTNKDGDKYINPNNAATVGDVLNAGWNLQNNGAAVDFVKPYDTVNFVNGLHTTAVVSTVDGKTSNVTYNVTGLPITYTDKDGNPVSKIGDKYYKVNEQGQPVDANGKPATKINENGVPVGEDGQPISEVNITNNPLKTSLVNPTPETNKTGTTSPTTLDNVTSKLENYKDAPVNGKDPVRNSLVNLSKPENGQPNVSDNTVATVGDLRNMGWIVSSNKTTGENGAVTADEYSATVKNANEVKFVGEGTAIVSGKTEGDVRTITVKVDDQTSTNNAVTPVVYTDKDGKQVYPTGKVGPDGNQIFNTKPDGKGEEVTGPVKTTINGPKGTNSPTSLNNVKNNIPNVNDGSKTITDTDGNETAGDVTNINKAPLTAEEAAALANPKTKEGQTNPKYIGNNAATVSDVLNAGWNLQNNGTAKDFVKPFDTVNFINGLNTTAVVTTSDDGTTSNVTYNVTGLPVTYTTEDGTPVTKIGDKYYKVNDKGQPVDGTGAPVTKFNKDGKPLDKDGHEVPDVNITDTPLKTSLVNPAPAADKTGTTSPTTLSNVKSNLPDTKNNDATTGPSNATTAQAAPNITDKTGNNYVNPNNAATVSDVLNAGWNLQGNGADVDFVKPYDKVNFVNGLNTTAVVSTVDGVTSNVTFNVTGLPITYTDKDGKPVSKIGDNFYTVNDKGQPLDSKGNPSTKVNNEGKPVDDAGNVITPIDTTNNPVKTSLVNPAPGANKTGTTSPTTLDNVTSKLENYKDAPVNGKDPVRNGLVNLSKPENGQPNVSDNTVATVGDLRNMGWIVSSNKTTGENGAVTADEYSATVKNANEVKFVAEGTAIVSGKTEGDVRTITVKVDDQTSTNNAVTPVVYTDKDGKQVYPTGKVGPDGNQIFNTKPDGKGEEVTGPVKTTINGPKGTNSPTSLNNVKNNIPNVNDGSKTITDTDGNETAGDVTNINKAPLTAEEAAALANPKTKEGQTNPKYIGNNAATVSDVLNAGWNLQGNGAAKDFVKPYDTVNFVNGLNTTAVVTTSDDGTTSNVTYNVTGLPVTYTTTDGTPVTKIGDKYYKVNDQGQPVDGNGAPVTKFNKDGKPLDKDGHEVPDVNITDKPLKTSLVNPAPAADKTGTTSPTSLSNVKNNIPTVNDEDKTAHKVDGTAIDGKNNTAAPITAGDAANLLKPTVNGVANPNFVGNNAATVSDVLNAGWNLQNNGAAKDFVKPYDTVNFVNGGNTIAMVTTNAEGTASDVTFNVTGLPIATTIATPNGPVQLTKVGDNYYPVNADGTPNIQKDGDNNPTNGYVKADNGKYYPAGDVTFGKDPVTNATTVTPKDGKQPVTFGNSLTNPNVVNTANEPNKAVAAPTTLNNVKNNIPTVNDKKKQAFNPDGTEVTEPNTTTNTGNVKAPITATDAQDLNTPYKVDDKGNYLDMNGNITTDPAQRVANPKYIGNNAATVSDVLSAGWNLQGNGTNVDFVKPYDTVNFRNGGNTTVSVTTDDNLTSHVQVNVTGLPVSNTITDPTTGKQVPVVKVGDAFYRANPDGTPNIVRNDKGEPTNGYVRANDGKLYPRENVTVTPPTDANGTPTITPNTGATPTTVNTNLVNPNVDNTTNEPGNNVSTPNQLGNVANGANTFNAVDADGKDYVKANNGKYYEPSKVNADGSLKEGTNATADAKNPLVLANDGKWYPADKVSDKGTPEAGATAVEHPLAPKNAAGEPLVQAKDGKWYKPSDLQPNGTPTPTAKPQDNAINNKAGLVDFSNSNPNNAATIGDLQNMGWVVSAQGNSYSDQVRNTNEVKFVGEGTAIVTGKTDDKGVRTITVKVDDQVSTNNSVTPVVYTDKDGKTVYPIKDDKGNVTYHTTPDGKGPDDKVIPNGDVNTSINGPKDDQGNTRPASLSNVKNNIPAVNDENKTITDADGKVKPDAGNVENINKAPLTAEEAADLLKPMKDGKANPNFVGNNAATVSDVLNAGWNLQNNGAAKDFVKPFDSVNFVNGGNTTAVVSTSEDGTTSTVTYNVTGLPVTYTTADGTPVTKIGDKYYKVNDKGQPVDEQGNPSTKVNNNGEPIDGKGNVINPVDTSKTPLSSKLVNPNVTNTADAPNKKTTDPTQLGNVTSGLQKYGDKVDGKPVAGTTTANTGLIDLSKPTNGDAPKVSDNTAATVGDLRNMGWIVSSDKVTNDDGTATVKDYTDQVRNANEVKFVGKGTAIVSGKTVDGVRTITVKVDDQVSTNNAIMPTSFTTKDGTKVYPVKDDAGNVTYHTTPDGKGTGDTTIDPKNVVTAVNGPNGTTTPTTLQNVKSNLPNVDDKKQKAFYPDGTEVTEPNSTTNTGNAKAPLSHTVVAAMMSPFMVNEEGNFIDEHGNVTTDPKKYVRNPNFAANNAATVGDVLSAGWNLQNNGESRDFVKPYDTVNFINGLGTTAVVTTREGNTTSDVTFNVKPANSSVTVDEDGVKVTTGEITPNTNGSVAGPTTPENAKTLKDALDAAVKELATAKDALKTAETALAAKPNDPALQKDVEDKKAQVAEKQTPVNNAQKAHDDAGLNKVATVQNVAEAINNSGFNLKTSADGGEKLTGTKDDGELIKPSNTVEMVAGNNLTVKQDEHGKITYATKDDVTFKTVDTGTLNVGSPNTYTDGKGNTYTKVGENYYKPADVENGVPKQGATPVDVTTTPVTPVSPVTMKAEAAKPATNNATDAQPSSALNVTSKDGKPTQITGVGSTLNTKSVDTTPAGTAPGTTPNTTPANLIDLEGTADAPVNKNAAATVGDLQNMGWVVSTKDGNGYKDVVKNANVVDFKGDQGVTVIGKTLADGTREITVGIKEGEVTNKVTITHGDGSKTDAVKIGDNYYKVDKDGKPIGFDKDENGKPAGTPLKVDPNTDKVTNAGAGVVTGNTVANAIQDSGWNVGIGSTDKDFSKDAKVYDKVNPNDDVKFANGANTNVSMVTVDALNEDGTKKATTYVKVDINRDLKIDSVTTGGTATDKNGNNLVKVGDQYYKEGDVTIVTNPDGTTTVTPKENAKAVPPADVIPPKDGAMIVKNADGKDVVSATVGKDGNGAFGINGKDGKNGISMTAKDGQGTIGVNGTDGKSTTIAGDTITIKDKDNNATNIGVNTITLVDKAGNTTTTTADKSEIKDAAGNINTNTATGNTLKDPNGNTHTSTASTSELKDKDGNTNTSTPTTNVLKDTNGNTNTSAATGTTYKDKDENKTVVGPKEINISDKSGENTASLTNKDLLLNAKDPNTGVDKTSHVSGDKISFTTTDEMEKVVDKDGKPVIDPATGKQKEVVKMEKVFDKDGKPVIDPATGKQKEVVKNPGNSTEYTNEGLKVIPNSTVARDVNGNPTFLDKDGKPVMKDTDGKYKYVGQDGKPGDKYDGSVGVLKPNVVDNTRVISFGMDKPVLDKNGKPVTGPDGNPVMTEGISAGMQQIHNVAPGTKDTDGVNVSQLRGTTININNRMNRMGAQAAALAGLQSIQYDPLEPTQISAGLGHYKGSSALALGVNHFKNESTMFHMGASYNGHGDETMMNASVTWKFGARADETAVKDTFRQGPISSAYTLQDKVSALEAQNKIQKDQLEELKALNEKQQEQIAELFKRLIEKA